VRIKKLEQGNMSRKTYAMVTVNHTTAHVLERNKRIWVKRTQYRTTALERQVKCSGVRSSGM
jgi:hypothetical protein